MCLPPLLPEWPVLGSTGLPGCMTPARASQPSALAVDSQSASAEIIVIIIISICIWMHCSKIPTCLGCKTANFVISVALWFLTQAQLWELFQQCGTFNQTKQLFPCNLNIYWFWHRPIGASFIKIWTIRTVQSLKSPSEALKNRKCTGDSSSSKSTLCCNIPFSIRNRSNSRVSFIKMKCWTFI